jgi:hypothetical protein
MSPNVTIPKGTEITAYTNGEIKLDRHKFQDAVTSVSTPGSRTTSAPTGQASRSATMIVASEPTGADIEVNGKFVGNTPSTIAVQSGLATVSIKKTGFKDWSRAMDVSDGSSINLRANLEAVVPNVIVVSPSK